MTKTPAQKARDELFEAIAFTQMGIDPRNIGTKEGMDREIEIASGGRGLGHLMDILAGKAPSPIGAPGLTEAKLTNHPGQPYLAKKRTIGKVTSLDSLIATGMVPPGLATQVVKS